MKCMLCSFATSVYTFFIPPNVQPDASRKTCTVWSILSRFTKNWHV